jgi:nucleoside-diphosphate-sugar epimerase
VLGDVRDAAVVQDACQDIDLVWHLASVNGTEFFYSRPDLVLDVGVRGMVNVLDATARAGIRELMVMSSSEVYQTPPTVPTDETAPLSVPDALNPRYSYAGAKIASELLALNRPAGSYDRVVIARPHNVYGPDMGWEHVIPQLTVRAYRLAAASSGRLQVPIQGTGAETRAFVFIDDLVDGLVRLMDGGRHRTIYHVGNDEEVSIADLAHRIGRCIGRDVEVVPGEAPPGGTQRRCPNIARMRALGYHPRISLDDGLLPTVGWYVAHVGESPRQATHA